MAVKTLYESENFLIVNKPYDMYINSDNKNEKNTVASHIASYDSHLSTSNYPLHFIQRLDFATSGVLCIAKNKNSAAKAGKLFERRQTKKYYLAIVRGHLNVDMCDIEFPIASDPFTADTSHKMLALTTSSLDSCLFPRRAHTKLLVLEYGYYDTDPVTVVLLKLITGRRHQLRVHCSAIGHTILGDYTYSNKTDITPHRMFLHATRLVLPLQQEPLDIQTDDPFFKDGQVTSNWKSERFLHNFKSTEDFLSLCDIIDNPPTNDVNYKLFKYEE